MSELHSPTILTSSRQPDVAEPVRVNLGCGNKYLDGWINVDKGDWTKDVDSDLTKLPFDDDYADEALSVHVIEHFYVWEAPDVLEEWLRILKPGGKLIIECPDLQKTILHMANGETRPELTMWPLYGDPRYGDPLMCHKWGYTPNSLSKLMDYVGFKDITEEPAQFHMKEIRDMRLIGTK